MADFMFPEAQALHFHKVLLHQIVTSPNLLARAREELKGLRSRKQGLAETWDRWAILLDADLEVMAPQILANTPDGGLLRANSPLYECLVEEERKALWQRVGLQQFVIYFHQAVDDLGLSEEDQIRITGLGATELAQWRQDLPATMKASVMDKLKSVVSIHRALVGFTQSPDQRRAWLDEDNGNLGGRPAALLTEGRLHDVEDYLIAAVQARMTNADRPSA
ncbi:antitoxin Xre/MbcA/ParS toxin-binding domain-containing protein [Magnetospira sp. QH-2]|uniref:antitoxin Xre/MbcA/ParS toxin-binding domain-containing protein n=1 Tax=Magnetospira sp. (strain QH-2) TaxID=1288970 RepID=UPI0003E80DDA|nr:antitoxin Xre/MbcA/ParS toxin-binding domain-containing protein [Magnetospira sp. QH-2]CCQ74282.1 Protein of unknown function [Magnetospira sp. QH-2]